MSSPAARLVGALATLALFYWALIGRAEFRASVEADPREIGPPDPRHATDFFAYVLGAACTTAIFAGGNAVRGAFAQPLADVGAGLVTILLLNSVLFLAVFLCLTIARAIGSLSSSRRVEVNGVAVLLALAIFLVMARFVLPQTMPPGAFAIGVAAAFAVAVAAAIAGGGMTTSNEFDDSAVRVLSALAPRFLESSSKLLAVWIVLLAGLFAAILAVHDSARGSSSMLGIGTAIIWLLTLAAVLRRVRTPAPGEPALFLMLAAVVLALQVGWTEINRAALPQPFKTLCVGIRCAR